MCETQVNINVIRAATELDGQRAMAWDRGLKIASCAFALTALGALATDYKSAAQVALAGVALSTLVSIHFTNAARRTIDPNYIPSARALKECRERMQALSPDAEVIVGYDLNRN